MWDGKGICDLATQTDGKYANYKLALILYASRVLGIELADYGEIEDKLWSMQQANGGITSLKDLDGGPVGSANTETTSMALLPYNEELISKMRSIHTYFLIENGDFNYNFTLNGAWRKEEWNKNEYTVVEIEDGILHLECNNTGEVWGNASVYQGKHIDRYDYDRKLLALTGNHKKTHADYIEFTRGEPIEEGVYLLETRFRVNDVRFTDFSVNHPNQYARTNLGITLMIVYNDNDIYGEGEKIYFDICFTGYCVNETNIWNVPSDFAYCEYHKHAGYMTHEVKPEEFGRWVTIKIDLGKYINGIYNLIKERDIEKIKVIGFILFAETSGCYVNADYDYVRFEILTRESTRVKFINVKQYELFLRV